MDCHIEIFIDGRWITAAVFEPDPETLDQGVGGRGRLQYDIIQRLAAWIEEVAAGLAETRPRTWR